MNYHEEAFKQFLSLNNTPTNVLQKALHIEQKCLKHKVYNFKSSTIYLAVLCENGIVEVCLNTSRQPNKFYIHHKVFEPLPFNEAENKYNRRHCFIDFEFENAEFED